MTYRLDEVVLRALEKEPERRYQQASEVRTQVETIAATSETGVGRHEKVSSDTSSPQGAERITNMQTASLSDIKAAREVGGCLKRIFLGVSFGLIGLFLVMIGYTFYVRWHDVQSGMISSSYVGQRHFPQGDSIDITSVERNQFQITVTGNYTLASHDRALLAFYITGTNRNGGPTEKQQQMHIPKGSGQFKLVHNHPVPGLPHVSMYAHGKAFASLYFGTKAEAMEEGKASWITNASPVSAQTSESTTNSSAIEQIQSAFVRLGELKGMASGQQYELSVGGKKELGFGDDFLRRRSGPEILESGLSSGCGDYAIAFIHLMTGRGFQTLFVDSAEISLSSLESHFSGHAVVAVRDSANQRWVLADPTNRRIVSKDWATNSQTFYGDRYWIGFCGPLDNYPAHTPDELKEFYDKTLKTVPPNFWNRHIFKFNFKIDPSLVGPDGNYLAPNILGLEKNQGAALAKFKIDPETDINILLVKGANDANGTLSRSNERGWICRVGLKSACSLGFVTYMQNVVADALSDKASAVTTQSGASKSNL